MVDRGGLGPVGQAVPDFLFRPQVRHSLTYAIARLSVGFAIRLREQSQVEQQLEHHHLADRD